MRSQVRWRRHYPLVKSLTVIIQPGGIYGTISRTIYLQMKYSTHLGLLGMQ